MALVSPVKRYGITGGPFWANAIDTIPKSVAVTGTFSGTTTTLTGTSTSLLTTDKMKAGDTLFNAATAEIFTIMKVVDDTHVIVDVAPAAPMVGVALKWSRPKFSRVKIENKGAAAATIMGRNAANRETLSAGNVVPSFVEFLPAQGSSQTSVEVIVYNTNAAATTLAITTE